MLWVIWWEPLQPQDTWQTVLFNRACEQHIDLDTMTPTMVSLSSLPLVPWSRWSGATCDKLLDQLHQLHLTCAVLSGRWEGRYTVSASRQGAQGLQLKQLPLEQHGKVDRTTASRFGRWSSGRCRKQNKQLRLLLCKLWKATELFCMLPLWLLLCGRGVLWEKGCYSYYCNNSNI